MKSGFAIALMILALSVYADAFGMWKGGCKTDDDCEETHCCVKQQIGSDFGQCLRKPQEGDRCVKENKYSQMFQRGTCPCAEGLICTRIGSSDYSGINYAFPPVCVKVETTTAGETTEAGSE